MIAFEHVAKFLFFLHLAVTFILVGSLTHNLVLVVGYLRGRFHRSGLEKRHVVVSFIAYLAVFLFGCLIYPTFRVRVRAEYFDTTLPWATGLFEVKEHWAALGLVLFVAYLALRRSFDPKTEREKLVLYVPLCFLLNIITWYLVIVGFYLTTLKGI